MEVWSHFSLLLLTVALVVFTLLQRETAPHLKIPYLPASLIPKPPYYGAQIPRSSNLTNRLLLLLVGMLLLSDLPSHPLACTAGDGRHRWAAMASANTGVERPVLDPGRARSHAPDSLSKFWNTVAGLNILSGCSFRALVST